MQTVYFSQYHCDFWGTDGARSRQCYRSRQYQWGWQWSKARQTCLWRWFHVLIYIFCMRANCICSSGTWESAGISRVTLKDQARSETPNGSVTSNQWTTNKISSSNHPPNLSPKIQYWVPLPPPFLLPLPSFTRFKIQMAKFMRMDDNGLLSLFIVGPMKLICCRKFWVTADAV